MTRLDRTLLSRNGMNSIGELVKGIIFKRVKSGFGVQDDRRTPTTRKKLKALSPNYIEQRRGKKLGRFGSPGFSNLTNTGQMLDSIVVKAKKGSFEVLIPNTRRRDTKLSNKDVASFARRQRPFFQITKAESRIVTERVDGIIARAVRDTIRG